ncbi:MAG: tRNA pseudouridine(55) synthase TruB [Tissierellia bacterium]|nr:tRNA pseudouridine(55) synthase TruB [Tissierellia bacterium]
MWGKINLYKPENMTSQQAVSHLRRILGLKRIGHSGTLDPMATGVLNCFVGRATRFIDLLPESEKIYKADFILGKSSDTLDIWGKVVDHEFEAVEEEELKRVLEGFLGESLQLPPMYSAIKYKGRALYDYAREGQEIERKKRRILISKLELLNFDGFEGSLMIHCSRGTYVRSLIDDIGSRLGTAGLMSGLVRLRNDWVDLEDCYSLDQIREMYSKGDMSFLTCPATNVSLARADIDKTTYEDLAQGRINSFRSECQQGRYLIYWDNNFVGTALCEKEGFLVRERIIKVEDDS